MNNDFFEIKILYEKITKLPLKDKYTFISFLDVQRTNAKHFHGV